MLYWEWFEKFFGGVVYRQHPAFQKRTAVIEDRTHPAMKNLPARFEIPDEWYECDAIRPGMRVLATVDESSYTPKQKMSRHPVVWTSQSWPRMLYIQMGHSPEIYLNAPYTTLLRNSILWALFRFAGFLRGRERYDVGVVRGSDFPGVHVTGINERQQAGADLPPAGRLGRLVSAHLPVHVSNGSAWRGKPQRMIEQPQGAAAENARVQSGVRVLDLLPPTYMRAEHVHEIGILGVLRRESSHVVPIPAVGERFD